MYSQNNSALPKYNTYHTENRLNNIIFDNKKLLKILHYWMQQNLTGFPAHRQRCEPFINNAGEMITHLFLT